MVHAALQDEILEAFRRSPTATLSELLLHAVAIPEGGNVTKGDVHEACLALVDEGKLDFERGGTNRRYRLR